MRQIFRSSNPYADAERYYDSIEIPAEAYPLCEECGRSVEDDFYIIDGSIYCEDCVEDLYKTDINTYLEDNDLLY